MSMMDLSDRAALEATKCEELRMAAREQIRVHKEVIRMLERCIKASLKPEITGAALRAVEIEFEKSSCHALDLAQAIGEAANLLKA